MGTVTPRELLNLWEREEITFEIATGHQIQNLVQHQRTLDTHGKSLVKLNVKVDGLMALIQEIQKIIELQSAMLEVHSTTLSHLQASVESLIAHTEIGSAAKNRKKLSGKN